MAKLTPIPPGMKITKCPDGIADGALTWGERIGNRSRVSQQSVATSGTLPRQGNKTRQPKSRSNDPEGSLRPRPAGDKAQPRQG